MNFGVPNQRKSKVEKYPNDAVVTMLAVTKKGGARSFMLNSKAVELLELSEKAANVVFSFEKGIFIANGAQDGIPEEYLIRVTSSVPRKLSDKRTYEYIVKSLELDDSVDNEFRLHSDVVGGINVCKMTLFTGNVNEIETIDEEEVGDKNEAETPSVIDTNDYFAEGSDEFSDKGSDVHITDEEGFMIGSVPTDPETNSSFN